MKKELFIDGVPELLLHLRLLAQNEMYGYELVAKIHSISDGYLLSFWRGLHLSHPAPPRGRPLPENSQRNGFRTPLSADTTALRPKEIKDYPNLKIHGAKSPQESVNLERTLSMQQREFLERARKALIKHGIIGSRAKALLEEWNDHLQSEVEKLVAEGQDRESSYQDACKALGEPESLVDSAAKQLAMESWQGRNPVLSSGILSVVVFLIGIFAT